MQKKMKFNTFNDSKYSINIMKMEIEKHKNLKDKLNKYLNFNIPDYVINDILENEAYSHICSMINLSVLNDRLTKGNGEKLKKILLNKCLTM